jgi:peptidoglycan/xylan/chitin deacetylase (PgdA/CDA1 family)
VTPEAFKAQLATLADAGFRGVSLREALSYREDHNAWPERSVALTFDDGYANFYDEAAPTLAEYQFTATVFVVSGHVGKLNDWAPPPPGFGARAILPRTQIVEISEAGIEIGAHTRTHKDLRKLSTAEAHSEIIDSRKEIEDWLGRSVENFAYPFGYVSPESSEIVRHGFRSACTTTLRRAGDEQLHELPRVDMYYLGSQERLHRLLHGKLDHYLTIRRLARRARSALL